MANKPTPIVLPEELKETIKKSLAKGETLASFAREAMRRELKRRGQQTKDLPEVKMGRPTGEG